MARASGNSGHAESLRTRRAGTEARQSGPRATESGNSGLFLSISAPPNTLYPLKTPPPIVGRLTSQSILTDQFKMSNPFSALKTSAPSAPAAVRAPAPQRAEGASSAARDSQAPRQNNREGGDRKRPEGARGGARFDKKTDRNSDRVSGAFFRRVEAVLWWGCGWAEDGWQRVIFWRCAGQIGPNRPPVH